MATSRAHLTVVEFCEEVGIGRSTFYDWRTKDRALDASSCPMVSFEFAAPSMSAGWTRSKKGPLNAADVRRPHLRD